MDGRGMDLSGSGQGQVLGCCRHDNGITFTTKCREILDQLEHQAHQILKKDCAKYSNNFDQTVNRSVPLGVYFLSHISDIMDVVKAALFTRWQLQTYIFHSISICLCSSLDKPAFNKFSIYFLLDGKREVHFLTHLSKVKSCSVYGR